MKRNEHNREYNELNKPYPILIPTSFGSSTMTIPSFTLSPLSHSAGVHSSKRKGRLNQIMLVQDAGRIWAGTSADLALPSR